jgi:hypothetical protein
MRMKYDAWQEHRKDYWLAVSSTLLILATIIGSLYEMLK